MRDVAARVDRPSFRPAEHEIVVGRDAAERATREARFVTDDEQTPEEIAAHSAQGSAKNTAGEFVDTVRNLRDWPRAMRFMTLEFRLACAQRYVYEAQRQGRDVARSRADWLALGDTQDPDFASYCEHWLGLMDELFAGWTETVGYGSTPRLVDFDHEVLMLGPYELMNVETRHVPGVGEAKVVRTPGEVADIPQLAMLMRRAPEAIAGWQVAGLNGDQLPQPGWPPQF
jgi:hypothetical protein